MVVDISRPRFDLSFGGVAVDSGRVRLLSYGRSPLQFEGAPLITGQIVLAVDGVNFDIDPERNRDMFGEFVKVELDNLVIKGNSIEPPFGRVMRIKKARISSYRNEGLLGQEQTETVLQIAVVDLLEYNRYPQVSFDPTGEIIGAGTLLIPGIFNAYLDNFNLELSQEPGDVYPTRFTQTRVAFPGRRESTVDHLHRLAMGSADDPHQPFTLMLDNQERVRIRRLDFNPATSEYDLRGVNFSCERARNPGDEQLPGTVQGTARVAITRQLPSVVTAVAENQGGGVTISRTVYGLTMVETVIIKDSTGQTTQREITVTEHDTRDRVVTKTKTSQRQQKEFTGDGETLVDAQWMRVVFTIIGDEVRKRTTFEKEIEASLARQFPEAEFDAAGTTLRNRVELVEQWTPGANIDSHYSVSVVNYIPGQPTEPAAGSGGGAGSRAPSPETRDNRLDERTELLISSANIYYQDNQVVVNPVNLPVGEGTFSGSGSFTGFGTLVLGTSTTVIDGSQQIFINGALSTSSGVLTGTGTYTGIVRLGRTREFDYDFYPGSQAQLDILTQVQAQIVYGTAYAINLELPIEAMGGGFVPPGASVDVLVDGEVVTGLLQDSFRIEPDSILYGGTLLKLGTRDVNGDLTLSARRQRRYLLTQDGDRVLNANAEPIEIA